MKSSLITHNSSRPAVWFRLFSGALLLVLLASAFRLFGAQYDFALAQRGRKTLSDYEGFLKRSLMLNPDDGRVRFYYANVLGARGDSAAAQKQWERSFRTYRPSTSWEQEGILLEGLARDAETTAEKKLLWSRAAQRYDELALMRPDYVRALERSARLGLEREDSSRTLELAREISRLDMNNLNSVYVEAETYRHLGDLERALGKLQVISTAKLVPVTSIFQPDEITSEIVTVKKAMQPAFRRKR